MLLLVVVGVVVVRVGVVIVDGGDDGVVVVGGGEGGVVRVEDGLGDALEEEGVDVAREGAERVAVLGPGGDVEGDEVREAV